MLTVGTNHVASYAPDCSVYGLWITRKHYVLSPKSCTGRVGRCMRNHLVTALRMQSILRESRERLPSYLDKPPRDQVLRALCPDAASSADSNDQRDFQKENNAKPDKVEIDFLDCKIPVIPDQKTALEF